MTPSVSAALASGAVVVTPNNRLARHLASLNDRAQRAAGRSVWAAPVVVPWHTWLERLWLDALASGDRAVLRPPRRITSAQQTYLWLRIVAAEGLPLQDERGAAELAAEAWALAHAWGAGGPSWRSWAGVGDDCAIFARWAETYAGTVTQMRALDAAQLPDWLAERASGVAAWRVGEVVLAGFIEYSPQQERLLRAVGDAGTRIVRLSTLPEAGDDGIARATRREAATPRDEVMQALAWARDVALANPGATIGVAVLDLESRRADVRALADEILCPALQWPGHEEDARPYNLSLGAALGDVPLVASALDVIALAHAPLPVPRAAALMRSPYLAGEPDGWLDRARLEADWLSEGSAEVSLAGVVARPGSRDAALAPLKDFVDAAKWGPAPPRAWAELWRGCLAAAGWPGGRALSSVEWQARGAWDALLAEFAALGGVARRLSRGDALAALAALARGKVFQPESAPAPIQILGGLEAAGLPLDALWVAGLAGESWPPAPRPNPLLPLAWQRERNVPRSTAARELAYAQALTEQWARGAPDVVFSCAVNADDHPRTLSSLVAAAAPRAGEFSWRPTARAQFASAPAAERVADDHVPPYVAGTAVAGGATRVAAQGDCPFQATAHYRLGADVWPAPLDGLSVMERGTLVHAGLAAFWRSVGTHSTLASLSPDDLAKRVDVAVDAAVGELKAARWARVPAAVKGGEAMRIAKTVRAWLDGFDRPRAAFAVSAVEATRPLLLGGLQFTLRIDRIDALAGGGAAIIDYKTGVVTPPTRWFDDRARQPQLGLYWLAEQAFEGTRPVRAVAYAQLRPGEMKAVGLAADAAAWPGLPLPSALKGIGFADWPDVLHRWGHTLERLADEVRTGYAAVAPRDAKATCRRCGRHALCRIGAVAIDGDAETGDD